MIARVINFASASLAWIRDLGGRSARMERELYRQSVQLDRMEKMMAENDSALLAKLETLAGQVNQYTTDQGNRIAAAVAAARKAQMAEDQESAKAELAAALAKIDDIGKGLVTFSPSAN